MTPPGVSVIMAEAGLRRDAIFVRRFGCEPSKLVEDRFLDRAPGVQEQVRPTVVEAVTPRPLKRRAGRVSGWMTTTTGGQIASVGFHVAELAKAKGPLYVWSVDETRGARETAVRASTVTGAQRASCVITHGVYLDTLAKSDRGQLILQGARIGPRTLIARLRRRLTRTRKKSG